jgi:hypothetical protein
MKLTNAEKIMTKKIIEVIQRDQIKYAAVYSEGRKRVVRMKFYLSRSAAHDSQCDRLNAIFSFLDIDAEAYVHENEYFYRRLGTERSLCVRFEHLR